MRVRLEEVLGHYRVNHHLKADPARRVDRVDERIEVKLLHFLRACDPLSSRNLRVAEPWSVHHGESAVERTDVGLALFGAGCGRVAGLGDGVPN